MTEREFHVEHDIDEHGAFSAIPGVSRAVGTCRDCGDVPVERLPDGRWATPLPDETKDRSKLPPDWDVM